MTIGGLGPNIWTDALAGPQDWDLEEVSLRVQELYRWINGSPLWGRPGYMDQYDGTEWAAHIQSLETTTSPVVRMETHDSAVSQEMNNDGVFIVGPVKITGTLWVTGNTGLGQAPTAGDKLAVTGDTLLTGNLRVTLKTALGASSVGAETLNVTGTAAVSSKAAVGAATVGTETLVVTGTEQVTQRLGVGAAPDGTAALKVTGAAIITTDLTVDTSTLKVDSANNRVGVLTATPAGTLDVAGTIRTTANTGTPATGSGLMLYLLGGSEGTIKSYNAGSDTMLAMVLDGLSIDMRASNASKFKIDATGVGWFTTAPVAQQAVGAAATDLASVITLANNIRTALRAYGLSS